MKAVSVYVTDDELIVCLEDGRSISTPLCLFPRLQNSNAKQRANYEIFAMGRGIHWPDLDEDISVNLLMGEKC